MLQGRLPPKKGDWLLIFSWKIKGLKVKQEDRAKIVAWVRIHPDMVCSPLRQDTTSAPAPATDDPVRTLKRIKLLLQTSVRRLHSNLFKQETNLPEIVEREERKQISNSVFRSILPSKLRRMSKRLKEVHCRRVCEPMSFKQDALNQWRRKKRHQLRVKLDELPDGRMRAERVAGEAVSDKLGLFGDKALAGDHGSHPTPTALKS